MSLAKNAAVAHRVAQRAGVLEDVMCLEESRCWGLRVQPAYVLGIVAEDRRLHVGRPDHVVRHHQEPTVHRPLVGSRDDLGQLRDGAGARVALQQQREHRHEVALAAAEAAVQVRALADAGSDGVSDQVKGCTKTVHELRRHHVIAQRLIGPLDAFGKTQDEVALMHAVGQIEDVSECPHGA